MFAVAILALVLTLPFMRAPQPVSKAEIEESMGEILGRAFRDPSYTLIFLGFFSCGYQLGFVTAHFPAFVTEMCGPIQPGGVLHSIGIQTTSALGAVSISLIGLANIAGTLLAGWAGNHFPKEIPAGRGLYRTDLGRRCVHPVTDHTADGYRFFVGNGIALACDSAFDFGTGSPSLWAPLHGHTLWYHIFKPSDRQLSGCLAGWANVRSVR